MIDVQGISDSFPLASRIGLSFDFALFVYMLGAANTPLELDYFVEETIAKRLKTGARREKYFRVSENFNRRKKKITKITKKKKNNHKNINFEIISKNYEIWERKPDNLERRMSDLEGQGYRLEVFGMKKTGKVYAVLAFMRQFLHFAKENGENTLDLQTCLDQSLLEKYFKFALSFLSFPFLSSGKKLQNKYR